MTAEFLSLVSHVRQRSTDRWSARCPAHSDVSPSLSITAGDKAVLVRCWAGCGLDDICRALGLRPADLFYDAGSKSGERRIAVQQRVQRRQQREAEGRRRGRFIDSCKFAERFLRSRQAIDISGWADDRLARELNCIADAYQIVEHDPYAITC